MLPRMTRKAGVAALLVAGCGTTHPRTGPAANPQSETTAVQSSEPPWCWDTSGPAAPFVVDDPEQQRSLSARVASGTPVVVAYDCAGVRVLSTCRAPGSYAFAPVEPRKIEGRLGGRALRVANLASRGDSTREVSVPVTGRYSATATTWHAEALRGECEAATHVAGAIWVDEAEVPVRLVLEPVLPARIPARWSRPVGEQGGSGTTACPAGFDLVGELCLDQTTASVEGETAVLERVCASGFERVCERLVQDPGFGRGDRWLEAACGAGQGAACVRLGEDGKRAGASALLQRGCDLGNARGCREYAKRQLRSAAATGSEAGYRSWRRACEGGSGSWCWSLGLALAEKPRPGLDGSTAWEAWVLGCLSGSLESCWAASQVEGQKPEPGIDRLALLEASCPEPSTESDVWGHWNGCMDLASWLERGDGVAASPARAAEIYERVCDMKIREGCRQAARMAEEGSGSDRARAARLYGEGCRLGDTDACKRAAELSGEDAARYR